MRSIKPTTVRLSDEDLALIEDVKRLYGQSSLIGAIRTALRVSVNRANIHNPIHKPEFQATQQTPDDDAHRTTKPKNIGAGGET